MKNTGKKTQRRDFLKQFLWGSAALYLNPFSISASEKSFSGKEITHLPGENSRKEALDLFYQKKYKQSESLFQEIITSYPSKIEYYDGLKKVLGAQNKLSEICSLYEEGLLKNRNNPLFYDRYSRALAALSGGNRKQYLLFEQRTGKSPINVAVQTSIEGVSRFPDKKYLKIGLLDIQKRADKYSSIRSRTQIHPDRNLLSEAGKITSDLKEEWARIRVSRKKNSPENQALYIGKPLYTPSKERRKIYFPEEELSRSKQITEHIQWIASITFLSFLRNPDFSKINNYVSTLSPQLMTDNLFGKIRKYARQNSQHVLLTLLAYNRYTQLKNFWRTISYADSLKGNKSTASKALSLYQEAEKKSRIPQPKKIGALCGGAATCLIQQGNYVDARKKLLEGISMLNGIGGVARGLAIYYSKTFIKENNYEQAENILLLLLRTCKKEKASLPENFNDPVTKYIAPDPLIDQELSFYHRLGGEQKVSDGEILAVHYALARLYIQKKDVAAYSKIKTEILSLSPDDRFIRKNRL